MNEIVSSHVLATVKQQASQVLASRGLSIAEFIQLALTHVAKEGLPPEWEVPNANTMSALLEGVNELQYPQTSAASSTAELERLLNE